MRSGDVDLHIRLVELYASSGKQLLVTLWVDHMHLPDTHRTFAESFWILYHEQWRRAFCWEFEVAAVCSKYCRGELLKKNVTTVLWLSVGLYDVQCNCSYLLHTLKEVFHTEDEVPGISSPTPPPPHKSHGLCDIVIFFLLVVSSFFPDIQTPFHSYNYNWHHSNTLYVHVLAELQSKDYLLPCPLWALKINKDVSFQTKWICM